MYLSVCVGAHGGQKGVLDPLEQELTGICESNDEYWNPNSNTLKEQQLLFTTKPALQLPPWFREEGETHAMACIWRSEDNFSKLVVSIHYADPKGVKQFICLVTVPLLDRHLIGPQSMVCLYFLIETLQYYLFLYVS